MEWYLVIAALLCLPFAAIAVTIAMWYQNHGDVEHELIEPAPPVPEGGEYVFESGTRRLYKSRVEKTQPPEAADPNENAERRAERETRLKRLLNARPDVEPRPAIEQSTQAPPASTSVVLSENPEAAARRTRRETRLKHLIRDTQSAAE